MTNSRCHCRRLDKQTKNYKAESQRHTDKRLERQAYMESNRHTDKRTHMILTDEYAFMLITGYLIVFIS